jgi:hypothetical protein
MYALLVAAVPGCEGNRKEETMHNPSSESADMQRIRETSIAFAEKKGWRPEDYRFEYKSQRPDGKHVVHLVYLEDERSAVPGGGQSVELFIDPKTFAVVETYRFQ